VVNVLPYIRKAPEIDVVKFDGDPVELVNWVNLNLPEGWTAELVNYNRTISVSGPNGEAWGVGRGQYFAQDSNGNLFKMTEELLTAFYDPTV